MLVVVTLGWIVWAAIGLTRGSDAFTLRVVDDTGAPISEAVVALGQRQLGLTDAEGLVMIESVEGPIEISAPGHMSSTIRPAAATDGSVDAVLKARVLRGRVVDASGEPVSGATVAAGLGRGTSDDAGRFTARGAESGTVAVTRPAWEPVRFEWAGGPGDQEVVMEPRMVKAVHMTGEAVEERLDHFVEMTHSTELNALMVDLKDESGFAQYDTEVATAMDLEAVAGRYDLAAVVQRAADEDLYLIGRLVAFQDPVAARADHDMAVWDTATDAPFSADDQYFLDPTDPDARAYIMEMAVEACEAGVDEIQFDYVRFPDSRPQSIRFDEGVTADIRSETIRSFLADAVDTLHPVGCAVAADVFGFVTTASDDGGIGQHWVEVTSVVDVASPMLYPSHYTSGWFGFEEPGDNPGEVVDGALGDAMSRLAHRTVVRPWLQDFGYDEALVREQIEVAESYGLGWMLWNAFSEVTEDALVPEGSDG